MTNLVLTLIGADRPGLVESLVNARRDKRDIGMRRDMERFARWRRSESEIMARGIHGIKSLFSIPLLAPLRKPGMALVSKSWLAREAFIIRAAGLHRNAAALSRGTSLQELVHSGD
jgi:2-polyprenyl-6-methoxyphenol hydroxylase-like FAD-dependent oxidoreductase